MTSLIIPVLRIKKNYCHLLSMREKDTGICFQFAKGICKRGDECKFKHIKDESNKEKQEHKSKFPNKNGKNQNNTTPTTS